MSQLVLNSIKGSLNVITGCGSGLGKSTLQWFLRHGCGPTLGIDRRIPGGFLESLNLDDGQKKKLMLKQHDTFDEAKVESSLNEFVSLHGSIDNLINVAGVSLAFTIYIESNNSTYNEQHARDLMEFNTVGTFNMIRQVSRHMIGDCSEAKKRSRCIVNAGCISTTKPCVGQSFYAASKSAIDSMTLCIARELGQFNIRCNTINIGYFDTPLLAGTDSALYSYLEKEIVVCPKRLGHPDEFAHMVQAVIENTMLNGTCIRLDACTEPALEKSHGRGNF